MNPIPTSPFKIPRDAYQRELACIDPVMYLPVPPTLRPLMPILKAIYQRTAPREPEKVKPVPSPEPQPDLAAMERRIIAAVAGRKPDRKPETQSPFLKRKEVVQLLKTRSVLEACERAGWLKATTRQKRLVLYRRTDVMACIYRLSQGEYP
jgi:hypothetical protein